ncbi:tripartite motif containing [Mactra antiquata]
MAEQMYGHQTSTLMLKINGELICGICLDFFTSPVMLTCGHNFCRECMYGLKEANTSFTGQGSCHCPLCHQSISQSQLSHLPVNRALESIINLYKSCAPCDVFDDAWHSDLEPKIGTCKTHSKTLDRYCDSCSQVICSLCEKSEHSSQRAKHRVEPVVEAVCSYQSEIASSLTELKKKLMPLNDRINYLENHLSEIQVKVDRDKKQMDEKFSELMRLLRSKQSNIISELDEKVRGQIRPLQDDINKCERVKCMVQDVISKLSHFRRVKDTNLLMQLMKYASKQLETLISLDINLCLRSQVQHSTSFLSFDILTNNLIAAIETLALEHHNMDERSQSTEMKNTFVQTLTIDDGDVMLNDVGNTRNDIGQQSELSPFDDKSHIKNRDTEGQRSSDVTLKLFDEPDGGLLSEKPATDGDRIVGIRGELAGIDCCRKKSPRAKHSSPQLDLNRNNSNDLDPNINKSVHDLDPGGAVPKVKGRQSFPTNLNSRSPYRDLKVVKAKSTEKVKSSANDNSNAAAIKTFVARRRTMSPSVSASSLDSVDKNGQDEKLSLRNITARKNASSPALKSLDSGFESISDAATPFDNVSQTPKTSDVDVKVSVSPAKIDQTSNKDTVTTSFTETKKTETAHVKMHPAAKSFSAQPINLNLDLGLDTDDTPSKRITNV